MKLTFSRSAKNAGWLIGSRIVQMLISFLVSMLTARYLGPSNYGLINYASSYTAFFTSLCQLGINSVLVKEYIEHPDRQGETTGTALLLQIIASTLGIISIFCIVSIADHGEPLTILVVLLYSLLLFFRVFDLFMYWFQARLESKYASIASTIATVVVAAYKIFLLATGKSVIWFALTNSLTDIVIAVFLYAVYKKRGGPALKFSRSTAKSLLGQGYHFILSGIMVSVYTYTDKVMLKHMISSEFVGYYSTASTVCTMYTFVLTAIIDSLRPGIVEARKHSEALYHKKITQLYAITFYTALAASLGVVVLAKPIILILYGESYLPAVPCLRIATWYSAFAYLGVARNIWLVCEKRQHNLKYIYLIAAVMNVFINLALIPTLGINGAALASLITQMCTSIIIPHFFREMRQNNHFIRDAILLRNIR